MSSLSLSKKTTKYKQRYQAILIALSIYYQVIVFIYSPTRMRVFEKPKTFLILTPKPENGSFLFRGSLNRCFLKMNDRRATFSFLHLVSVKSYSVFFPITAKLNILILIKEIFDSATNYVKSITTHRHA